MADDVIKEALAAIAAIGMKRRKARVKAELMILPRDHLEQVERALAPFARVWELLRAARLEGEIAKHSWLKQMHEATGYSSIEFCNAFEALALIRAAIAHSGETDEWTAGAEAMREACADKALSLRRYGVGETASHAQAAHCEEIANAIRKEPIPRKGTENMSERAKRRISPEEFRMARRELELTQTRLGQLLGVSAQAVARWEKGQTAIPVPAEALTRIMLYQQRGSSMRLTDLLRSMTTEPRP
jgi:DNA-binding transcriptional regulator YiaG